MIIKGQIYENKNISFRGQSYSDWAKLFCRNPCNKPELFKNTSMLYLNPCDVMDAQVNVERKWFPSHMSGPEITFLFKFSSDRYLEIISKKAYDDETLLGQVGGYIGRLRISIIHLVLVCKYNIMIYETVFIMIQLLCHLTFI